VKRRNDERSENLRSFPGKTRPPDRHIPSNERIDMASATIATIIFFMAVKSYDRQKLLWMLKEDDDVVSA